MMLIKVLIVFCDGGMFESNILFWNVLIKYKCMAQEQQKIKLVS